ncbi:hypothetical protein [Parvularcula oceani]|uniref:hypothetical protein n=1 Tax=Parvularcula oceani TaxID=1247963 RepID=UPI0012DC8826|nr:hypothetical protein [Parvularcula oceani]
MAKQLQSGALEGNNLDAQFIAMEQSAVQEMLNSFKQRDPSGYNDMIAEVNALLNPTGAMRRTANARPTDAAYLEVVDKVRSKLGRDIDFENQEDREAIGHALVGEIRGGNNCMVTGSHIRRC